MNKILNANEKICTFYASDYHFEMISLPYINKKLEEQKEVIILTQTNLEPTVQTLLSKINLKENKKKNILNLNWQNGDSEKIKKIEKDMEKNKNVIIFIKGEDTYIKNINKKIEEMTQQNSNVKIINCFDINEVGQDIGEIMSNYKKILNTTGEKEIEKL